MATTLQAAPSSSALSMGGGLHPIVPPPSVQAISTLSFSKSFLLAPLVLQSKPSGFSGRPATATSSSSPSSSSSFRASLQSHRISNSRVAHTHDKGGRLELARRDGVKCKAAEEGRTPPTADTNVFVRMAWYGSEAFGKVASAFRPKKGEDDSELLEGVSDGPVERKDAIEFLRGDLDRTYFVNGNITNNLYEQDCEFADPFVSFKGLKRFKQNVKNLGAFMEESSLKVVDWQEYEDRIYAKWRFKCVIALPWRPILAASGSTEYFFKNDSGRIYKHVENWDISPVDGLKQLIKPNPKRKSKKSSSS